MRLAIILAAWLGALAVAAPARATDVFTVAGGGSAPLREGGIAGAAHIAAGGIDVAADPRGGFAFTTGGALWHAGVDGRLHRLASGHVERIAYSPDGALFAGAGNAILRFAPEGSATVVAGRPDTAGFAGDGGPATAALLTRPQPTSFDRDGGLLIIDAERVRRLAPDGTIATVVTSATAPLDVAAAPDGAIYVTTSKGVRRFAPDGTGTDIGPAVRALAVRADGTLVEAVAETSHSEPWVYRYGPGPFHTTILRPADVVGFDVWNGWDVLGSDTFVTEAIEATADGGLLIAGGFAIQYAVPDGPAAPAVAIASAKLSGRNRVRVTLRLTVPAAVRVTLWKGSRALASAQAPAGGQSTVLVLHHRVEPAIHRLTVEARPSGEAGPVAAAESYALLARALPVAVAEDLAKDQALVLAAYEDFPVEVQRCRRLGSRRVDCPGLIGDDCAGVLSMVWGRDGHLTWTVYGARRGACRIRTDRDVPDAKRRRPARWDSLRP